MIIPDGVNILLVFAGLLFVTIEYGLSSVLPSVMAAIAFGGGLLLFRLFFFRLRGMHGLGLGDIKFVAAAAIWVGLTGAPGMLLLASLTGIGAHLIVSVLRGRYSLERRIPFGPHLAFSLFFTWSFGPIDQVIF